MRSIMLTRPRPFRSSVATLAAALASTLVIAALVAIAPPLEALLVAGLLALALALPARAGERGGRVTALVAIAVLATACAAAQAQGAAAVSDPTVTTGAATAAAAPDFGAAVMSVLNAAVTALLTFGGGSIGVFLVGTVVDWIVQRVPFLAPFRELVKQWLLATLERIRVDRAKRAALDAGAQYRAEMALRTKALGERGMSTEVPGIEALVKQSRNEAAQNALIGNKTAKSDSDAKRLLNVAVAELKNQGVNP